jgi:hypothetical protein
MKQADCLSPDCPVDFAVLLSPILSRRMSCRSRNACDLIALPVEQHRRGPESARHPNDFEPAHKQKALPNRRGLSTSDPMPIETAKLAGHTIRTTMRPTS